MDFGVTDKLTEYYLKSQIGINSSENRSGTDFAKQLAAAKSEAAAGVWSSKSNNTETAYYMGKPYEEALSKITDPVAKSAFQQAYALKMAGGNDYISRLSKECSAGKVGATNFEDAFSHYDVITHVGNADIPSWKWQRNDFPFWKYFQKNTSADALNDWEPKGENPSQLRSDLQRNYGSVGAGKIAVLMPDSLKEKMDADPVYAQQIVAKLQAWKEDYDRWNNLTAASYGYNVAEHQASLNYVFDLDENGDIKNCTVSGSGGTITGPSDEELRQIKAEQAAKRKRMAEHTKMLEESSLKRAQEEKEAIIKYYVNAMAKDSLFNSDFGGSFMDTANNFSLTQLMLRQLL